MGSSWAWSSLKAAANMSRRSRERALAGGLLSLLAGEFEYFQQGSHARLVLLYKCQELEGAIRMEE